MVTGSGTGSLKGESLSLYPSGLENHLLLGNDENGSDDVEYPHKQTINHIVFISILS